MIGLARFSFFIVGLTRFHEFYVFQDQEHDNMNVVITIMDRHGSSCTERHQNGKRFVAERKTRTMYSRDSSYHKVDKWSRICFPLLYALFLLGYWLYYSYVYDAL